MNSNKTYSLEDPKINIRIKLSALWITAMLCYTYCDFLGLFMPGFINETIKGNMGFQGATTQVKMFFGALVMSTPALMVFLSLILKPKINRILNIILGIAHTLLMLATFFMEPWYYYFYFGIIEMILTLSIVRYAIKWPKI